MGANDQSASTDPPELTPDSTVWITTNSGPSEETFHIDEDCHMLDDENGWTRPRDYGELPDTADACGHCGGTLERGSSDGDTYTSYAKELRYGDLDPDDIVEPLETPEPGHRARYTDQ